MENTSYTSYTISNTPLLVSLSHLSIPDIAPPTPSFSFRNRESIQTFVSTSVPNFGSEEPSNSSSGMAIALLLYGGPTFSNRIEPLLVEAWGCASAFGILSRLSEEGELDSKIDKSYGEKRTRMAGRQAQIVATQISIKLQIEGMALFPGGGRRLDMGVG
jgi:hypothetical protein